MDTSKPKQPLTPTEFSRIHRVNRYNVYFWMKKYSLGYKDGRFWMLTPEEQQEMLTLNENRPESRTSAKTVSSRSERAHATQSVESLMADLDVSQGVAEKLRYILDGEISDIYFETFTIIGEFKKEYETTYNHEKVLLIAAKLLGLEKLACLSIGDGYPQYKFIKPKNGDDYTVVYAISKQAYYIDIPNKMREVFADLKYSEMELRVS